MFVLKVSVRADHDGMTFDEISSQLLAESGTVYDRRPISALINFLDNRNGTERWAHFRDRPQETAG